MITQETAGLIWKCYREIEAGRKLLKEMSETIAKAKRDDLPATIQDSFGRPCDLQLGVPLGPGARTLYSVAPDLAISVIRAHVANQEAELVKLNEIARTELSVECYVEMPGDQPITA